MQRIESQPAYILHARSYQETSLLLELFTRDYGRIAVIAKGAKRAKNPRRGLLQPFVPLLVSCAGKGELLTLKEVDIEARHLMLTGRCLVSGFYLNELLIRLLHRCDPHSDLFPIYRDTLVELEQGELEQKTLRLFEKALLKALGYELQLTLEIESNTPVYPDQFYFFDPERGPFRVEQASSKPFHRERAYPQMASRVYKGKSLLALYAGTFNDTAELLDAKRLLRSALLRHLGNRPLESRRLLLV